MDGGWVLFLFMFGMFGLVLLWFVTSLNRVIKAKNYMESAWSGIQVQHKRHLDLIPEMTAIVNDANSSEVVDIINQIGGIDLSQRQKGSQNEVQKISDTLSQCFKKINHSSELKKHQRFLKLQQQVIDIDHDLQLSRRYFNGTVRIYNNLVETFPGVLIARFFNFQQAEYFEFNGDD